LNRLPLAMGINKIVGYRWVDSLNVSNVNFESYRVGSCGDVSSPLGKGRQGESNYYVIVGVKAQDLPKRESCEKLLNLFPIFAAGGIQRWVPGSFGWHCPAEFELVPVQDQLRGDCDGSDFLR